MSVIFETERFIIRKLRLEDLEEFYDMQSNENVMRYIKAPLNYEESEAELEKFIGYYSVSSRYFYLWAIESMDTQEFAGLCGVYHNAAKENEIAYRLREQFWGRGIGSEVVKKLIYHCMSTLSLPGIVAFVDEDNVGSVKILEKEMEFLERFYVESRDRYSLKFEFVG